jgi:hypothetical protein
MEFKEKIFKEYNIDLPIKSGDGISIENPIVIDKTQQYNYVRIEKDCITYACRILQMEWFLLKQALVIHEGKYIDVIKIGMLKKDDFQNNFEIAQFYFDISDCIVTIELPVVDEF